MSKESYLFGDNLQFRRDGEEVQIFRPKTGASVGVPLSALTAYLRHLYADPIEELARQTIEALEQDNARMRSFLSMRVDVAASEEAGEPVTWLDLCEKEWS